MAQRRSSTVLLVVAGTLFALALHGMSPIGHLLWPPSMPPGIEPTPIQIALLMGVSFVEALAFGAGLAFVVGAWPMVRQGLLPRRVFVAVAWLLMSWVPHDNLHMAGGTVWNLIAIEWGFHVTLVLAALVLGSQLFGAAKPVALPRTARSSEGAPAAATR